MWHNIYSDKRIVKCPISFCHTKITDNKTKYNWYPSLLWKTKIKKTPLITIGFPKIRYTTNFLYDMEASGFFKGAREFVGPEMVQCIKIISDNKKNSILNISSSKIENWINNKITIINKLIKFIYKSSKYKVVYKAP